MIANTGDASGGGVLALASGGSDMRAGATAATPGASNALTAAQAGSPAGSATGSVDQSTLGSGWPYQHINIDGFEDHSLHVTGNNQIATNDDSNVFVNHYGPINANTGDTDSSGLIAVDVAGSVIHSGASGGVDPDDEEEPEDEDFAEPAHESTGTLTADTAPGPVPSSSSLTIGGDGYDDISVHAWASPSRVASGWTL